VSILAVVCTAALLLVSAVALAATRTDGARPDAPQVSKLRATTHRLRVQLRNERAARRRVVRVIHRRTLARPDVQHAIQLGAAAFGQSPDRLRRVAACESNFVPTAQSGPYEGLFQFGAPLWERTPFADFDRSDPYAAAFAASWAFSRGLDRNWPVCGRR
jgi:hypothetical protein